MSLRLEQTDVPYREIALISPDTLFALRNISELWIYSFIVYNKLKEANLEFCITLEFQSSGDLEDDEAKAEIFLGMMRRAAQIHKTVEKREPLKRVSGQLKGKDS